MDLEKINVQKKLKIVFMGTPEFSVPVLEGLLEKYQLRAVVTQPDRRANRGGKIQISPVKDVAVRHNLLVLQPYCIRESYQEVLDLEPDLIITCAYGQILPKAILDAPKYGCINVHASLLPKLRGGAPIHRAIMNGYKETGVTIMYMDMGMDQGDIISQRAIPISDVETAASLYEKLSLLGRNLLLDTLPDILSGKATRTRQNHDEATYAFTIKREDERIDFSKTKKQVYNLIRGLNSWPGAYCMYDGKILKVWQCYTKECDQLELFNGQITRIYPDGFGVKVSNGEIVFTVVQLEGKKPMRAVDFVNGVNQATFVGKILD